MINTALLQSSRMSGRMNALHKHVCRILHLKALPPRHCATPSQNRHNRVICLCDGRNHGNTTGCPWRFIRCQWMRQSSTGHHPKASTNFLIRIRCTRSNCTLLNQCISGYSSTCHGRPPLVQRKSGPSWQVAPRDRELTYAPLCQIKHTHQTAYISQHMHNIIKHSGQLQCCIQ